MKPKKHGWNRVEDCIPEGAEYRVLGYNSRWGVRECWFNGESILAGPTWSELLNHATHWMYLPDAPDET